MIKKNSDLHNISLIEMSNDIDSHDNDYYLINQIMQSAVRENNIFLTAEYSHLLIRTLEEIANKFDYVIRERYLENTNCEILTKASKIIYINYVNTTKDDDKVHPSMLSEYTSIKRIYKDILKEFNREYSLLEVRPAKVDMYITGIEIPHDAEDMLEIERLKSVRIMQFVENEKQYYHNISDENYVGEKTDYYVFKDKVKIESYKAYHAQIVSIEDDKIKWKMDPPEDIPEITSAAIEKTSLEYMYKMKKHEIIIGKILLFTSYITTAIFVILGLLLAYSIMTLAIDNKAGAIVSLSDDNILIKIYELVTELTNSLLKISTGRYTSILFLVVVYYIIRKIFMTIKMYVLEPDKIVKYYLTKISNIKEKEQELANIQQRINS